GTTDSAYGMAVPLSRIIVNGDRRGFRILILESVRQNNPPTSRASADRPAPTQPETTSHVGTGTPHRRRISGVKPRKKRSTASPAEMRCARIGTSPFRQNQPG